MSLRYSKKCSQKFVCSPDPLISATSYTMIEENDNWEICLPVGPGFVLSPFLRKRGVAYLSEDLTMKARRTNQAHACERHVVNHVSGFRDNHGLDVTTRGLPTLSKAASPR